MSNIYVRLKEFYPSGKDKGKKISVAIDLLHKTVYPGTNRWQTYPEKQLELIKQHRDFEYFEIKTADNMEQDKQNYEKEIEEFACMQFRKFEKEVVSITNKQKLKDIAVKAKELGKNKVSEIASDRLEELDVK
jgi:hypothetical protein